MARLLCVISATLFLVSFTAYANEEWTDDQKLKVANLIAEALTDLKKNDVNIDDLLVDTAQGHISAASLLGISADAVSVVENTKGFVAAIAGSGNSGSEGGFSVAPGRTSMLPMSLSSYYDKFGNRLLGNLTLSYAQGVAEINSVDFERRAFAIETSAMFNRNDDPILAAISECKPEFVESRPGEAVEEWKKREEENDKKYIDCVKSVEKRISEASWSVSRLSLSVGTGNIKSAGTSSESLGTTVALGAVYAANESVALSGILRRAVDEPILESLTSASVQTRSTTLGALRITVGGKDIRGLAEVSNADTENVTVSQRMFQYAAGFDYRVAKGVWFGFRIGKQSKIDGTGEETVSLLDLSFSPKPLH